MEENIALERRFKSIIDPLKQIVENTVESSKDYDMKHSFRKKTRNQNPERKRSNALYDNPIQASTPVKSVLNWSKIVSSTLNEMSKIIQPRDLLNDHASSVEEIFEVADEPLITSIRHLLQTFEGQEQLHANYGPLR